MPTPDATLNLNDPSGSQNSGQEEQDQKLRRVRLFLAIYYVLLPIVLIFLLFKVFPSYPWPTVSKESNDLVNNIPIYFFGKAVATSLEDRLLLLVIVAGALGSYIHSATSYSDFVGNRQFSPSWTLWYALRPLIGVSLALILYFVTRGGLLLLIINGGDATKANNINPFGVAAVAGLTGMFSKVAADKLAEVFTTLFKSQGDQSRRDGLAPAPAPEIKDIDKKAGPIAGGDTVTITGSGFASGAKVSFDNIFATNVTVVNDTTVTAVTPAGSGTVDVVVLNPDGQSATATSAYTYADGDSTDTAGTQAPVNGEGSGDQDAIDGCDVELATDTSDEDLPITEGGVN
jgi:hypothetical protein